MVIVIGKKYSGREEMVRAVGLEGQEGKQASKQTKEEESRVSSKGKTRGEEEWEAEAGRKKEWGKWKEG